MASVILTSACVPMPAPKMTTIKNKPILLHFYYITSCLPTHCLFGRFFLAFLPLYSGERSPLSWGDLLYVMKSAHVSRPRVLDSRHARKGAEPPVTA
jgi:hypothetical protein